MDSEKYDEGKELKDALPGEIFLFAIQGFIFTGELLIKQNPNSKAQLYVEPAKQLYEKLSALFEIDPTEEHYSYESIITCLGALPTEECAFAVKMVYEYIQDLEITMVRNPYVATTRPNVVRNYEILNKMMEELDKYGERYREPDKD